MVDDVRRQPQRQVRGLAKNGDVIGALARQPRWIVSRAGIGQRPVPLVVDGVERGDK